MHDDGDNEEDDDSTDLVGAKRPMPPTDPSQSKRPKHIKDEEGVGGASIPLLENRYPHQVMML